MIPVGITPSIPVSYIYTTEYAIREKTFNVICKKNLLQNVLFFIIIPVKNVFCTFGNFKKLDSDARSFKHN